MPLDPGLANQTVATGTGRLPIVPAYITFGDPVTDPASALGQITFDAVLTEEHEQGAVVTDHPVEDGLNIVDNVRPLPDRLALEVFVSNSPINSPDGQWLPLTLDLPQPGQGGLLAGGTGALVSQGLQALGLQKGPPSSATAMVTQFTGDTDYVRQVKEQLEFIRDSATLCTIICPQATYKNMILERFTLHRDKGTGTSGEFQIEFRQIRIVSSNIVAAPLPSIPRAAPQVSKGKKDAALADVEKESVAHNLLGKLL